MGRILGSMFYYQAYLGRGSLLDLHGLKLGLRGPISNSITMGTKLMLPRGRIAS